MLANAVADKGILAKTVLFDSRYAARENLKLSNTLKMAFYAALKSNRLVGLSKEEGHVHLDGIDWTPERLKAGVAVKLKKVPFKAKLFKLAATNGDIGLALTNGLDDNLTVQAAQEANGVRWQVGQFQRGTKQLAGPEKCQCRKARSRRNHLACCYGAWVSLKVKAKEFKTTLYQMRKNLFYGHLKAELDNPRITAYSGG